MYSHISVPDALDSEKWLNSRFNIRLNCNTSVKLSDKSYWFCMKQNNCSCYWEFETVLTQMSLLLLLGTMCFIKTIGFYCTFSMPCAHEQGIGWLFSKRLISKWLKSFIIQNMSQLLMFVVIFFLIAEEHLNFILHWMHNCFILQKTIELALVENIWLIGYVRWTQQKQIKIKRILKSCDVTTVEVIVRKTKSLKIQSQKRWRLAYFASGHVGNWSVSLHFFQLHQTPFQFMKCFSSCLGISLAFKKYNPEHSLYWSDRTLRAWTVEMLQFLRAAYWCLPTYLSCSIS